ncbi:MULTISPECIES: hypothetical protein [unclassified Halorubrum]|jgi:hypothetical protein|uniref:hypothetical protein n=1 Tax=unclassified Halorubrum TaxID=2642239 RepID=UPI0011C34D34|nr:MULTISPECIES: hypothetical protein [unclassified Halorubrum]
MKSNRTRTPHNPEDLQAADYDDASLIILKCLDRHPKCQANSVVIRRETGLPKHKVEQRIRADGILVRAGLVEKIGYDSDTNYAHPPKVMALTQYALDAIYYGFFEDDVDETAQVVLDEEQFITFEQSLSGLEARFDRLRSEIQESAQSTEQWRHFVLIQIHYEVAMLRDAIAELGVSKETMEQKAHIYREKYRDGVNLRHDFYSDSGSSRDPE